MTPHRKRNILVTTALTYANGPLHLGHLVEYIQTDIWVRFQKMHGNNCIFIGGSDCHGTPIMIQAEKENLDPEELVNNINQMQKQECAAFLVDCDNFYTTHSVENRELVNMIYERLNNNNDIIKKNIAQAFDAEKQMFLPDRYIKGECPRCHASNQYGDNCEVCGATYSTAEIINPKSILTNTAPIMRTSEHYFFALPKYTTDLKKWTHAGHLQEQVANKLDEWFATGLKDWDISRDAPYFGFKIPNTKNKYFYVWLDAPIGYIAAFKNLCKQRNDLDFAAYWHTASEVELYHFLGKDIMYFHSLFWPAVLMGAKLRTPTAIFVHGFLTINGEKMSKSRGTLITAQTYLKYLAPEYLRYYFAAKLSANLEDIDLSLTDFRLKINSELVGKVVNIASRAASFINKHFANKLAATNTAPELLQEFIDSGNSIAKHYENREFSRLTREIILLADRANQYFDTQKPWQLIKDPTQKSATHAICSITLNLFRILMIYLKPILPALAEKAENFLNLPPQTWFDRSKILLNHKVHTFKPLIQRIETTSIEKILAETQN